MTAGSPLLVSADDAVVGAVLRLAAAAGVTMDVVPGPTPAAMRAWGSSSAVLVGADRATALAATSPQRRDQVHVVSVGRSPDALFRSAVDLGAASVLELPSAEGWLVELLTDLGDGTGRTATAAAFVGGSGGVGATVLAAAFAVVGGRTGPTLLIDLDPLGPGVAQLLGFEGLSGVTWPELTDLQGRVGSRALRESLPGRDGVAVLGWSEAVTEPPPAGLVRDVVGAGRRGHDWVVLDVPRGAAHENLAVIQRCEHVVLVAGSTLAAVTSAARTAERLRALAGSIGLVVRSRGASAPAAEVARAVGVPLLAELTDQRRLDEHLDLGLGPVHRSRGPLLTTARELVRRLAPER